MTPMNAIEIAQRQGRTRGPYRQMIDGDAFHGSIQKVRFYHEPSRLRNSRLQDSRPVRPGLPRPGHDPAQAQKVV